MQSIKPSYFILLLSSFIVSPPIYAVNLGTRGTSLEIKEPHLLMQMEAKLSTMSKEEIAEHQANIARRMIAGIEEPKSVKSLYKATNTRTFKFDPTFVVDKDYKDLQGNIIALKGTKINPLDHINYDKELIFIDGNDKKQINWLKEQNKKPRKIILVSGRPFDLEKEFEEEVYFDQKGALIGKFSIKAVPARVWQEGKLLIVQEVALEN